jgi:hypothetical protein
VGRSVGSLISGILHLRTTYKNWGYPLSGNPLFSDFTFWALAIWNWRRCTSMIGHWGCFLFVRPTALRFLWFSSVLLGNSLSFCPAVAFKPIKIWSTAGAGMVQSVYWATGWTSEESRFDSRQWQVFYLSCLLRSVQTCSGSHPPSDSVGTANSFSESTATRHDADHSPYLVLRLRMGGSAPSLSHRPSWRAREQLQFIARAFTGWSDCPCYSTEMKTIDGHDGRQPFHLGPSNQQTTR